MPETITIPLDATPEEETKQIEKLAYDVKLSAECRALRHRLRQTLDLADRLKTLLDEERAK